MHKVHITYLITYNVLNGEVYKIVNLFYKNLQDNNNTNSVANKIIDKE